MIYYKLEIYLGTELLYRLVKFHFLHDNETLPWVDDEQMVFKTVYTVRGE